MQGTSTFEIIAIVSYTVCTVVQYFGTYINNNTLIGKFKDWIKFIIY